MIFAFKHMERSEAIEDNARASIQEVFEKFSQNPTSCNVTFSANSKFQSVHISAHLADGHQIELEQGEEDMYKSIELISDKLSRHLDKHKNKAIAQRNQPRPDVEEASEESDER